MINIIYLIRKNTKWFELLINLKSNNSFTEIVICFKIKHNADSRLQQTTY